jgi:hypothetical protein
MYDFDKSSEIIESIETALKAAGYAPDDTKNSEDKTVEVMTALTTILTLRAISGGLNRDDYMQGLTEIINTVYKTIAELDLTKLN